MDQKEKRRAENILDVKNRKMFVNSRSMLKTLLSNILGVKLENIQILEGVNGKPYLKQKEVFFNLSHSEDVFVIAITALGQIGVDVEPRNRILDFSKIRDLVFSEDELNSFERLDQDLKQEAIVNLWTRKESFFKALGSGLTSPLKELEVTFVPGSEPVIKKIGWKNDEKENWKMISLDLNGHYIGAISVQTRIEKPILSMLTFENFKELNQFN